jgi:hypothetical protein
VYYLSKNYFDILKTFFIFTFLSTVFLIFLIFFPNEAFLVEPYIVIDNYRYKEYVGPDLYGHHNYLVNISKLPQFYQIVILFNLLKIIIMLHQFFMKN